MKTQMPRFTLLLLFSLACIASPLLPPVCVAQTQDYSTLNLPDGAIARLGKGGVSSEHRALAFSPDGSRLAVISSLGVWLYELETFDALALLTEHAEAVDGMAFSPDSTKLAVASSPDRIKLDSASHLRTGTIKFWHPETGQNLATFQQEKGGFGTVAFSPGGTKLVGTGFGGIRLWNVETGRQLNTLRDKEVDDVAFSPDGRILAGTSVSVVNQMQVGVVKLWDVETGRILNTLTATQYAKLGKPKERVRRVNSVAFSPDGKILASGSASDGTVKLWEVATGKNINTFTEIPGDGDAMSVAFSPDSTKLAVGSAEGITLLEVLTGQQIYTRRHVNGLPEMAVFSVAFSPDGRMLASASWAGVKLWDVSTGENITTLTGHTRMVGSIAFAPDGRTLASSALDGAEVWDAMTGGYLDTLAGHPNLVSTIAYSPDGAILATGSYDGITDYPVKLWAVSTGKNITTLRGPMNIVTDVAYSPDGKHLASASSDNTIRLWDVSTGHQLATLEGHKQAVSSIAISPDGTKLASGSEDTTIRLWEISTGRALYTIGVENSNPGVEIVGTEILPEPTDGDVNGTRTDDAVEIEPQPTMSRVESVAFAPDGLILAAVDWDSVKLWEVATGRYITTLTDETHSSGFSAAFSPDGTKLASGSWDDTVQLWDVSTRKHIATFPGHTGYVNVVVFSPDSTKLASGSFDGTVLLWDVSEGIKLNRDKRPINR